MGAAFLLSGIVIIMGVVAAQWITGYFNSILPISVNWASGYMTIPFALFAGLFLILLGAALLLLALIGGDWDYTV